MSQDFFQEQLEQSEIKSQIVSDYFTRWAYVMRSYQLKNRNLQKIAYIDLFAGPGMYDDNIKSTPILIMETIIKDQKLYDHVVTLFNDKNKEYLDNLSNAIAKINGIEKLRYPPKFLNFEVANDIAQMFSQQKLVPTFFFIDPWGYKGLSLKLVSSFIKDWGSDGVLFINYNRINMAINNPSVNTHMISLFGQEHLDNIHKNCINISSNSRELYIVQELCQALKDNGCKFVLPFRFKSDSGSRTSHHLFFVTKNFLGYDIMKEIMYKKSSTKSTKFVLFEYNKIDKYYKNFTLFDFESLFRDKLKYMLLKDYAGQTIDFSKLYEEHSVDKPYIKDNYKDVLKKLLTDGFISAVNPSLQVILGAEKIFQIRLPLLHSSC